MTVIAFPTARLSPIDDPADISAVEASLCAISGLVCATGGHVALAGRELASLSVPTRIALLSRMYDRGEVAFDYVDARSGEIVSVVIGQFSGPQRRPTTWRAEVDVARAGGRLSLGALSSPDAQSLGEALLRGVSAGFSDRPAREAEALAQFARR